MSIKMHGKLLLDTNIVIGLFANEQVIINKLHSTSEIYLPCIVLGELRYGALNSKHQTENLQRIEEFMSRVTILDCNHETAREYSVLKMQLKRDGHPIPENDIWIAAIARQNKLTIVTRDIHFRCIIGLQLDCW